MAQNNTTVTRRLQADDTLSIKDMLLICLRYWPWFVLSVVVIMGAATLYLLSTPKVYTRTASILVKSSSTKRNGEMRMYEELGVSNLTSDINDEVVAIHSPAAVYDMVRRLHLDLDYKRPGFFRDETLFANSLPVEVEFEDIKDDETASFTLELTGDGMVTISDMVFRGRKIEGSQPMKIGRRYKSPFGIMTIKPALGYKKDAKDKIVVTRSTFLNVAGRYGSLITALLQPEAFNIIDIKCNDVSIPRADNILSTMINIYNENWVKNRNQISVATNEFIKERLVVIEQELGHVDKNISDYKSVRAMPDVMAVAGQAMGQQSATEAQSQQLNNQLYMVKYVRNYISDDSHASQLLPASSGVGAAEAQITEYNNKLLQRNNLVANSSEQNPLVQDMDVALQNMRSAIINSLDNEQATLNIQLRNVQAAHGQAMAKLSANPQQANDLLSKERQQKVKESLYLFLLQKREENELSQAFTAYNTRIIANPYGSSVPTSPESNKILLMALALALALPAAFFIIRENSNSKVRGRKDIEGLSLPYVGELPLWKPKKGEESTNPDGYQIVVKQHSRDLVNEAFRVVRTNLEFMTNPEKKCKLIMLTSFNPGSGKTFICANIGASFSIRGSRVICIDLDLRRGSLSEFVGSPRKGITDYLSGHTDDYTSVIVHDEESGLDFMPVGKMPPNPTELLYSPRLKPMLDELRQKYDYVFVDCPPVEIVADATIISHESDITLFIIRAGMLERSMLPELEKNYEDKKYNNMAMLLNGTDASHSYGYHRYGYAYGRYGYGYGNRYGYGYYGSKGGSKGKKS